MIKKLSDNIDSISKGLVSGLHFEKKWLGPNQKKGIISKKDIIKYDGEEGLNVLIMLLDEFKKLHK